MDYGLLDQSRIEDLIRLAQAEAATANAGGNPPFGAILTDGVGNVIAAAHNTQVTDGDPVAHGEINLLRAAAKKLQTLSFPGCLVFVNAEPCSMCMSAIIKAGIRHVYYGAPHESHLDPYLPAADVAAKAKEPIHLHPGILAESCAQQIAEARAVKPPLD